MRRWFPLLLMLSLAIVAIVTCAPFALSAQDCSDDAEISGPMLDPDATTVAPQSSFTASWTVRNSGDCTWSRSYRLIFSSGERMEGPRTLRLSKAVKPGDSITLTLDLSAPDEEGEYTATWQLRNGGGDDFGPPLTLSIEVAQAQSASGEVVLPEVLVFGGMGDGDDPTAIAHCVTDGALPDSPTLVVDSQELEYRHAVLYLCSFSEGAAFTVTVTAPDGNTFQRSDVQGAPVTGSDLDQNRYTGAFTQIDLNWLTQSPAGEWLVDVSSDELTDHATLELPEAIQSSDPYPMIDNLPSAPIDPFAAAGGCHYQYQPGQEMVIVGTDLPANTTLQLGFYHSRFGTGYVAAQEVVQTDDAGDFTLPYHALAEPGNYDVITLESVDPAGYLEDGTQYDLGLSGGESSFTCFTVLPAETPDYPVRLAIAAGNPGLSDINIYDYATGETFYPTYNGGACDSSEAGWWRGGEWILYQSNCVKVGSGDDAVTQAGDQIDLYTADIMTDFFDSAEDRVLQLTDTPNLDETEPDGNSDGLIVYRQVLSGTSPAASGELWLLDSNDGSAHSLGLSGRAPAWSPDGKRIAFMSDLEVTSFPAGVLEKKEKGRWQIYVYDLADQTLKLVSTGCRSQCRLPAWSPDGKQLLYEVSTSTQDLTPAGLWIAAADGSSRPRRFLAGPYGHPSWSSSGWIVFEGPDGIYRTQPDSQAGSRPTAHPTVERYFYSDPNWLNYSAPLWSH